MIGAFNRSHYEDVLAARVRELVPESVWRPRYAQIVDFERMLADNRVIIRKCLLHVSRVEQHARLTPLPYVDAPTNSARSCSRRNG